MDGEVTQYKDWGIPLGRRFRALKLWFHLRLDGVEAIRARLRRDLANAALAGRAGRGARPAGGCWPRSPCRRCACGTSRPALALRRRRHACSTADALDAHTLAWVDAVNASGRAFLTPVAARRALDGPGLDRRRGDAAGRRRRRLGPDARHRRNLTSGTVTSWNLTSGT